MPPRPTPTALKVIRGKPGRRPLNASEPVPALDPADAPPPEWLGAEAAALWRSLAPELQRLGLLTTVDRPALAAFCDAYSEYVRLRRAVRREGALYRTTGRHGEQRKSNPAVSQAATWLSTAMSIGRDFGLTPSARGRLSVLGADLEDDDFAREYGGHAGGGAE